MALYGSFGLEKFSLDRLLYGSVEGGEVRAYQNSRKPRFREVMF